MSKQIFISHASSDAGTANKICAFIESHGISCWIAPRDVRPGYNYDEEIVDGIERSKVILVLLSEKSNLSSHVKREIEIAINNTNAVFPIRIQDVKPGKGLKFFLAGKQWLDAWKPPLEAHLEKLVSVLHELLEMNPAVTETEEVRPGVQKSDRLKTGATRKADLESDWAQSSQTQESKDSSLSLSPAPSSQEEPLPSKEGTPEEIEKSIIEMVDIKTQNVDSRQVDGCQYVRFVNSNSTQVYTMSLSASCSYDNFLWLVQQSLNTDKDDLDRIRHFLLALEFAKRHRRECDPELMSCDFEDSPYVIQESA